MDLLVASTGADESQMNEQHEMNDLEEEVERLNSENLWLSDQVKEAQQEAAQRQARGGEQKMERQRLIAMLQQDLHDAEVQRDDADRELQVLEQRLQAEIDRTNHLHGGENRVSNVLSESSRPRSFSRSRSLSPPPEKTAAVDGIKPAVGKLSLQGMQQQQGMQQSGAPSITQRTMSPRERFGAPGARANTRKSIYSN